MAALSKEAGEELLLSLHRLFEERTYSDLTIICGDHEFNVHKAVICPRSSFFAKACDSLFQEGSTGVVSLPDDDPQIVKLMLHYLYHLDYPRQPGATQGRITVSKAEIPDSLKYTGIVIARNDRVPKSFEEPNLSIHAKLYALAEKYDMQTLKTLALEKFKEEVKFHWNTDDFVRAAEEAYTSTLESDRGLRNVVVDAISVDSNCRE
ncbi:hypothetical protein VTH06DRAFT_4040 [Thermothelomyces fergusii]